MPDVLTIARVRIHGRLRMVRPGGRIEEVQGVAPGVVVVLGSEDAPKLLRKRWVAPGPPSPLPSLSDLPGHLEGRSPVYVKACSVVDSRSGAVPIYEDALGG